MQRKSLHRTRNIKNKAREKKLLLRRDPCGGKLKKNFLKKKKLWKKKSRNGL